MTNDLQQLVPLMQTNAADMRASVLVQKNNLSTAEEMQNGGWAFLATIGLLAVGAGLAKLFGPGEDDSNKKQSAATLSKPGF